MDSEQRATSFRISHRLKICSLICAIENNRIDETIRLKLGEQLRRAKEEFQELYGEKI